MGVHQPVKGFNLFGIQSDIELFELRCLDTQVEKITSLQEFRSFVGVDSIEFAEWQTVIIEFAPSIKRVHQVCYIHKDPYDKSNSSEIVLCLKMGSRLGKRPFYPVKVIENKGFHWILFCDPSREKPLYVKVLHYSITEKAELGLPGAFKRKKS